MKSRQPSPESPLTPRIGTDAAALGGFQLGPVSPSNPDGEIAELTYLRNLLKAALQTCEPAQG